jgi:hypothetical protein
MHAAEQHRPDVAEKRAHWHEQLQGENTGALVFVDESGANTQTHLLQFRGYLRMFYSVEGRSKFKM